MLRAVVSSDSFKEKLMGIGGRPSPFLLPPLLLLSIAKGQEGQKKHILLLTWRILYLPSTSTSPFRPLTKVVKWDMDKKGRTKSRSRG